MTHLQDDNPVNITMATIQINSSTPSTEESTTLSQPNSEWDVVTIINKYGLPTVCMFGIVGNILNLTILTRRKLRRSLRTVEQAANLCLIALALSDFMFCLFALPTTFLPSDFDTDTGFIIYYGMYSPAFINVFILTSTWLTVTMATERYFAICHPLNQNLLMTLKRTKLIIVIVYVLSVLFNVPVLWRNQVVENVVNNSTKYIQWILYHLEMTQLQIPLIEWYGPYLETLFLLFYWSVSTSASVAKSISLISIVRSSTLTAPHPRTPISP